MKIGDFVYVLEGTDKHQIPLIVTHMHGNGYISGVAFSGHPDVDGYSNSGTQVMSFIQQGDEWHQWQHIEPVKPKPKPRARKAK